MDRMSAMERGDCLHLLSERSIGRVAFTAHALPAIRSLAYSLVGDEVVLYTRSGSLAERLDGQVVAFAVDELGGGSAPDWSVVVTGLAQRAGEAGELPVPTEAEEAIRGQAPPQLVRITSGLITGRWDGAVRSGVPPAEPATSVGFLPRALESY